MQHGRKAAANSAFVELHRLVGTELGKDFFALLGCQTAEIELVMIAQKLAPLRGRRPGFGVLKRLNQRAACRPLAMA